MKRLPPASAFNHKVEFTRGVNGRWIAKIRDLPGVTAVGRTRDQALAAVEAAALQVIVDRLDRDEAL